MQKFVKKFIAMLLVFILTLSTAMVVSANEEPAENIDSEMAFSQAENFELLSNTTERILQTGYWLLETLGQAGFAIAIVDSENDFVWTYGFGYADTIRGIPVTEDTVFGLASISKVFTAIAVMQLVEEGVLRLDDAIVDLLPGFKVQPDQLTGTADYRNITVRMLLSHASGLLNDLFPSGTMTVYAPEGRFMQDFLVNLAGFPSTAPEATMFAYANNNFTLLGVLLASLAGYDDLFYGFESLMQENIFVPLGMDLTAFILDERHTPHLSMNYQNADLQEEQLFYNFLPTGGLNSTARDMSRFMTAVLQGGIIDGIRILNQATLEQMMTPQNFTFDNAPDIFGNRRFGLGFHLVTEMNGFTHWGHGGTLIHHHSSFALDMDNSLGVFVVTNSVSGMIWPSALANFVLQWAVEEKTGELVLPLPDPAVHPIELTFNELLAYEGFYVMLGIAHELARIVASEEGFLYFHGFPGTNASLVFTPLSDGSFVNANFGMRIWIDDSFDENIIYFGELRTSVLATQISETWLTIPDGFYQWVGTYHIVLDEPHHRSTIETITIGIDPEFGFGYMRSVTRHGLNPFGPLIHLGDGVFLGHDLIMIDSVAHIRAAGMAFSRID